MRDRPSRSLSQSANIRIFPEIVRGDPPQRRYMRISIALQSLASVPPAPELMVSTAPRPSPSPPSMFRSSRVSIRSSADAKEASSSSDSGVEAVSSVAPFKLSLANSYRTSKSSTAVKALSKSVTQDLTALRFFVKACAAFGSFQKSGASVFFCSAAICSRFPGMSKTPPQRVQALMQRFDLIFQYHNTPCLV